MYDVAIVGAGIVGAIKIKVTLPAKIGDVAAKNVCVSNLVVTAEIK